LEAPSVERKLAAIFAADVEGYSRLMGRDEVGTLRTLTAYRVIVDRLIASHRGRIFNTAGDSILADFASAVDAVQCAVAVQEAIAKENADRPPGEQMRFRIGLHVGDIMVQGDNLFGDGVNIAARLEALAEPGGICVSRVLRDQIRDKLPYAFEDMGEQRVKNIARPVRVYSVSLAALKPSPPIGVASAGGLATPATVPRLSIVVLPFANLSNDPEQEYFADGITDDLTTDLSRISGSFVIARNTAFTYKTKPVDVKQVGRELGVRYVLEGSVRRTSDRVRVNVQLIDAETGAHLWADRFETDNADIAEAQDAITGRLAQTLNVELLEAVGRRIEQERVVDPDSRDLVMRGWAWYYRPMSLDTVREAQRAFEQAVEVDPRSIDARIGTASVLIRKVAEGWSTFRCEDELLAEKLLLEALERDTNRPSAHYAFGMLRRVQNRLDEARMEFETTIALDRNHARAFFRLGQTMNFLGHPAAGISYIEKSIRLNPRDPNIARPYAILGTCHFLLGRVDQGIDLLRQARVANPRFWWLHLLIAGALGFKGDVDGARGALAEAMRLKPEVNSLAQWHAQMPWATNPCYMRLAEPTLYAGLRRAGFPDE
jgi:TolB-like protein/class 3 adenylate cyclase/Flp pilus assembly protein TadD